MKLFVLARIFPLNVAFRIGLALALLWPSVFYFTLSGANQYTAGSLTNPFSLPAYQGIHQVNEQVDAAFRLMSSTAVSPQWWSAVQENIRASEYNITWQDSTYLPGLIAAYQAPNRAQNLRAYFTSEGVRVIPRTGTEPGQTSAWEWGLSLTGIGNGPSTNLVSAPELVVTENRVEYRRSDITEWYINDEKGLEQGFTIHRPSNGGIQGLFDSLLGRDNEGELVVSLAVNGNLTPGLNQEDGAIEFITVGGVQVLRYGELKVYDATGRSLPSRFELMDAGETDGRQIMIVVNALQAVYPITIDPVASSPSWTVESNQINAEFGNSVGTAGDMNGDGYSDVIVGARMYDNGQTDEGRAYVYLGSASGLSSTAAWTAESNQNNAYFGSSVGTAGDVNGDGYADVIVGAYGYGSEVSQTDEGRAYVYLGSASGLNLSAAWTGESDKANAYFGYSVGTAGDVNGDGYSDVIVGAYGYGSEVSQTNEGRAYVYLGSASGLNLSAAWTAESNQPNAQFGKSVGTAGDVDGDGYSDVIVGAYGYDNGQSDEGRGYVFLGSATGLNMGAAWTAESDQAGALFGSSVGTAGDVNGDGYSDVIVGAYAYESEGLQNSEGRAYLYLGSASGLGSTAVWTMESNEPGACFGWAVGTAGDVNGDGYSDVIIGARYYTSGQLSEGKAYVFLGSRFYLGGWPVWSVESDQLDAQFGISVGTAGDVNGDGYSDVIVGAHLYNNDQADEGRAFVYHGSAGGPATVAAWTREENQASAYFGYSVGTAGDVNGDGFSDVIVGAPYYDSGQADEGRAFVYLGSRFGPAGVAAWTAESDQEGAQFGYSVGTAGDVNGDGYSDVIIGAWTYTNGQWDEGKAYVYHGASAGGLATSPAWTAEGEQDYANFGNSVGTAGDVNGDGYSDIIVGAYNYDNGQTDEGRTYVYMGSASGLSLSATWVAESDQAEALFGWSAGTAGDVNGDGYSDVIVGAYSYDNGQADEGRAYVYLGSGSGLNSNAAWTAESELANAGFGNSVGTAGDVNGDGYSDVILGAAYYDNGQTNEGRAYVYHGSSGGLANAPAWTREEDQANAYFGHSVGTAGDVNGDGYSDVIVGAYNHDNGQTDEGRAYVYLGSGVGLATAAIWTAEGDQAGAEFGSSVGTAGDVNGDGYSDVIVGASNYDGGQTNEGRTYFYFGNGGEGLDILSRQLRSGETVQIAPLGKSDSATSVQLRVKGRMPLSGNAPLKLQWQVAPLGTSFNSPSVISGTSQNWVSAFGGGVSILTQTVSGLSPHTNYHWRVRTLYKPGNTMGLPASRWISANGNSWAEADFRTPDETITGLSASNNGPTVLGGSTTLTANISAGSNVSYSWAFGDGASAGGANVSHVYPAVGSYNAVVTASNSAGSVTSSTTVNVTNISLYMPVLMRGYGGGW